MGTVVIISMMTYKPELFDGTAMAALQSQCQLVIGSLLCLMLRTCPNLALQLLRW